MALSYKAATIANSNGSTANGAVTLGAAVAIGDLIICCYFTPATSTLTTPGFSDTVDTGAWNVPAALTENVLASVSLLMVMAYIRADAAGTPTINVTGMNTTVGWRLAAAAYTGFLNPPALVSADVTQNHGNSAAPAATGFTNSVANELSIVVGSAQGNNFASVTGSFTGRLGFGSGPPICLGDVVQATSGNAIAFGATTGVCNWGVMIASFQDLAVGGVYGVRQRGTSGGVPQLDGGMAASSREVADRLARRYFLPPRGYHRRDSGLIVPQELRQ